MTEDPFAAAKNDLNKALGMLVALMAKTPGWAEKSAKDIYERNLPPLAARQFRLAVDSEGEAVSYISWALASKAVEEKAARRDALAASDWQSGDTGLVVDVVCADAKAATRLVAALKQEVFADRTLKALRVSKDGAALAEVPPAGRR